MKRTVRTTCGCGHVIEPTPVKSGAKAFTRCRCGKMLPLQMGPEMIDFIKPITMPDFQSEYLGRIHNAKTL